MQWKYRSERFRLHGNSPSAQHFTHSHLLFKMHKLYISCCDLSIAMSYFFLNLPIFFKSLDIIGANNYNRMELECVGTPVLFIDTLCCGTDVKKGMVIFYVS